MQQYAEEPATLLTTALAVLKSTEVDFKEPSLPNLPGAYAGDVSVMADVQQDMPHLSEYPSCNCCMEVLLDTPPNSVSCFVRGMVAELRTQVGIYHLHFGHHIVCS